MESAAALAAVKAITIPLTLLSTLDLTGPLFPPERIIKNNSCFDYIIIGGGTAGCVIANRLSENHRVLLIEAGGDPPIQTFFPPFFVTAPNSTLDWNFTSIYDNYAANSQNNYTKLTAGKCLGGSSSINHFIEVRGAVKDYNDWADIVNDPSWRYDNLLPYFKKKENLKDREILDSPYRVFHGTEGPMGITREPRPEVDKIMEAFNETGNPLRLDVNGNKTIGYTSSLLIVTDGKRQSSAYSYLTPIRKRNNLYVLRNTLATRIIFENQRAVAVVTIRDGKKYIYRACKEIIVCAGVFNTPALLMRSGIGPRKHLESLNINVIADLPVGDNFQDQVGISLVYKTAVSIAPPPPETVILTEVPFPIIVGLKALDPKQLYADYQVFSLFFSHDLPFILLTCAVVFQNRNGICDRFNNENKGRNSLYTLLTITQPKSRGNVRLNSTDPFDKPLITTGYFTNETDLDNMVRYIKDFTKVGNSTHFKKVGAELIDLNLCECSNYTYGTDEYWRCYSLHTSCSVYHSSSTCAMGTVVDNELKVYNVTNLRIADASVMPNVMTNGSPHEAVMTIAEKASDMIKEDSNKKAKCNKLCQVVVDKRQKCKCSIKKNKKKGRRCTLPPNSDL